MGAPACEADMSVSIATLTPNRSLGAKMAVRAVVRAGGFLRPLACQMNRSLRIGTFVDTIGPPAGYEAFANPPEWRYVERLAFPKTVPPPKPKAEYPSRWQPRREDADARDYDVLRTKNAMLPVYMRKLGVTKPRLTLVRRVRGDVGALKEDLIAFIEKRTGCPVAARAHEVYGQVQISGDHYYDARDFLLSKGF